MRAAFLLVALLVSAQSQAEQILTTVAGSIPLGCCAPGDLRIAWTFYADNTFIWEATAPWLGVPQRRELAANNYLNFYQSFDWSVENPPNMQHMVSVQSISRGRVTSTGLAPEDLFSFGAYDDVLFVVPNWNPPNGNSFVGTAARFTDLQFTLGDAYPPDAIGFTVRFLGVVPEPSGLMLCLIASAGITLRRRRW